MIILLMVRQGTGRTDLLEAGVADATWRRYKRDVQDFISWAEERSYNPETLTDMDWVLVQYIHECFDEDPRRGRRQRCVQARAGIILKWPHSATEFLGSRAALKGWARKVPVVKKQPCPKSVCFVLIEHFIKRRQKDMALILWVMFDAYLRIGEALKIGLQDVLLPSETSPGGIRLPVTKTGQDQSVIIRDESLWKLLRNVVMELPDGAPRLFQMSYAKFQKYLAQGMRDTQLQHMSITAHSFRHGGASEDHLRGVPLADIIQRGRWRVQRTAEYYIQSGRALLLGSQVPANVRSRGDILAANHSLLVLGL
jgi:site-specific recombinase XerD